MSEAQEMVAPPIRPIELKQPSPEGNPIEKFNVLIDPENDAILVSDVNKAVDRIASPRLEESEWKPHQILQKYIMYEHPAFSKLGRFYDVDPDGNTVVKENTAIKDTSSNFHNNMREIYFDFSTDKPNKLGDMCLAGELCLGTSAFGVAVLDQLPNANTEMLVIYFEEPDQLPHATVAVKYDDDDQVYLFDPTWGVSEKIENAEYVYSKTGRRTVKSVHVMKSADQRIKIPRTKK